MARYWPCQEVVWGQPTLISGKSPVPRRSPRHCSCWDDHPSRLSEHSRWHLHSTFTLFAIINNIFIAEYMGRSHHYITLSKMCTLNMLHTANKIIEFANSHSWSYGSGLAEINFQEIFASASCAQPSRIILLVECLPTKRCPILLLTMICPSL